jgi:flagellin
MRGQIRGLDQASRNAQDGISLIQTAEGAMATVNEIMIRVRELVVQAANDTNVHDAQNLANSDRVRIQDEIDQLMEEIDQIAQRTEFNTRTLLDGSWDTNSVRVAATGQAAVAALTSAQLLTADLNQIFQADQGWNVIGNALQLAEGFTRADVVSALGNATTAIGAIATLDVAALNNLAERAGIADWATVDLTSVAEFNAILDASHGVASGTIGEFLAALPAGNAAERGALNTLYLAIGGTAGTFDAPANNYTAAQWNTALTNFFNASGSIPAAPAVLMDQINAWAAQAPDAAITNFATLAANQNWGGSAATGDGGVDTMGTALWFHVGANTGQGINIELSDISTGALFNVGANHNPQGGAGRIINVLNVSGEALQAGEGSRLDGNYSLLEAIDNALSTTTRQRSALGAVQNRLEFTIQNLDIASENLSAANSRIRDADMALEMMRLTQSNVLQQAATAMLAQANQSPQSVLQLLG